MKRLKLLPPVPKELTLAQFVLHLVKRKDDPFAKRAFLTEKDRSELIRLAEKEMKEKKQYE